MRIKTLSKNEVQKIEGGGLKEAAITAFFIGYKYSSLSGALMTGLIIGYMSEK